MRDARDDASPTCCSWPSTLIGGARLARLQPSPSWRAAPACRWPGSMPSCRTAHAVLAALGRRLDADDARHGRRRARRHDARASGCSSWSCAGSTRWRPSRAACAPSAREARGAMPTCWPRPVQSSAGSVAWLVDAAGARLGLLRRRGAGRCWPRLRPGLQCLADDDTADLAADPGRARQAPAPGGERWPAGPRGSRPPRPSGGHRERRARGTSGRDRSASTTSSRSTSASARSSRPAERGGAQALLPARWSTSARRSAASELGPAGPALCAEELVGRQVAAVVNFPPRQIAKVRLRGPGPGLPRRGRATSSWSAWTGPRPERRPALLTHGARQDPAGRAEFCRPVTTPSERFQWFATSLARGLISVSASPIGSGRQRLAAGGFAARARLRLQETTMALTGTTNTAANTAIRYLTQNQAMAGQLAGQAVQRLAHRQGLRRRRLAGRRHQDQGRCHGPEAGRRQRRPGLLAAPGRRWRHGPDRRHPAADEGAGGAGAVGLGHRQRAAPSSTASIQQLAPQIDAIATQTKFNSSVLLDGGAGNTLTIFSPPPWRPARLP